MTYKEKLAYLAGFADGEGHFCVRFIRRRKTDIRKFCRPEIIIMQVNRESLDWCKENFGGNVYSQKRDGTRQEIHRWVLVGQKAVILAKDLEPYLIVKREQVKRLTVLKYTKRNYLTKATRDLYAESL